jgi:uncharacterized protein (DUF488 family)
VTEPRNLVLTVGHSTHSFDAFLNLLRRHSVTALADVRSAPFSRFNPQFNKDALERDLKLHAISYVFLGRELGARSSDPSCYENGRVQYARLARTGRFRQGIERVMRGAHRHRIALLCAEREPLECHRTLLVSRALDEQGVPVAHILGDGGLETQHDAMERLLDMTGLPHQDLFLSREELISHALARQEEKVAYVDEELGAAATASGNPV